MKFVLTLAVVLVLFSQVTTTIQGKFAELLRVDCFGQAHLLVDSPLETHVDIISFKALLTGFSESVSLRAKERCPQISNAEIKRRMVPSFDFIINLLSGNEKRQVDTVCSGKFSDHILSLGPFLNLIIGDSGENECSSSFTFPNLTSVFPSTCSLDNWLANKKCTAEARFQDVWGGMKIQFGVGECSDTDAFPEFSILCDSPACVNYLKPCTADNQCGANLGCSDLGELLPSEGSPIQDVIAQAYTSVGLWNEGIPSQKIFDVVLFPLRRYLGTFYDSPSIGSSNADFFKYCLPKYDGKNIQEVIEDQSQGGIDFEEIFVPNSGAVFECSTEEFDLLKTQCENSTCTFTGNTELVACANSGCHLNQIGDGRCDPLCNITACAFDGSDCTGPASIHVREPFNCSSDPRYNYEEVQITCNNLYAWNGRNTHLAAKYGGVGEFQTAIVQPIVWPSDIYGNRKTRVASFDCNGVLTLAMVTSGIRAQFSGLLKSVKKFEEVYISIVKEIQLSGGPSAPALVTNTGRLTELGIALYGIYSPQFWLMIANGFDPEVPVVGADFATYATAPGWVMMNLTDGQERLSLGDTCTYEAYKTTKFCKLQYTNPLFGPAPGIDFDLKGYGGIHECASTHIPEVAVGLGGAYFDPFPLTKPCVTSEDCPNDGQCVNLLGPVEGVEFTSLGFTFPEVEYDLFTFLLYGRAGRDPNYASHQNIAWATEDILRFLRKIFENSGANADLVAFDGTTLPFGSAQFCFPANDPIFVPLLVNRTLSENLRNAAESFEPSEDFVSTVEEVVSIVGMEGVPANEQVLPGFPSLQTAAPTIPPPGVTVPPTNAAQVSSSSSSSMLALTIVATLMFFVSF